MKIKWLKIMILFLFILFNALSVYAYMHLKNKIQIKHDIIISQNDYEPFNDIKLNEDLITKPKSFSKLVLVDYKKNIYELVKNETDIYSLFNIFKDNIYKEYKNETVLTNSMLFVDDMVVNYDNELGFYYKDNDLNRIEVYKFDKILGSKNELYDYNDLMMTLGEGTIIKTHNETYDYYILAYKHNGIYLQFISFYEDGRNNICILSKDILM